MTLQTRKMLEVTLKQRYRELWNDVRREMAASEPFTEIDAAVGDLDDAATADVLIDTRLAEIDRDIAEMRDIDAALKRIVDGSYGTCIDCEDDIPEERLLAHPTARRCRPCQERYERQRRASASL